MWLGRECLVPGQVQPGSPQHGCCGLAYMEVFTATRSGLPRYQARTLTGVPNRSRSDQTTANEPNHLL
ncbi:hypothetical protein GCM10007392_34890 [Saccharospirillum salsuginis]|uniref:Uncharacterized protein n=1 Tax=Saccharospirillum salsuginis TaxID=418750 RepID=A0A918KJM6_9GAMM|nr:hypothetical protein GCM10007392_34890 [Saccharospirillum salsuginis]